MKRSFSCFVGLLFGPQYSTLIGRISRVHEAKGADSKISIGPGDKNLFCVGRISIPITLKLKVGWCGWIFFSYVFLLFLAVVCFCAFV